ncbi:transporter substrate-binding domain-containing protein [Pseudonocardia phyllosphaerae]|uniref:transporter substrate-binding domain-containing protein n=1 Tax=Pseudonocardia phyllosphaerae TaxID=3390502 RepID=UPI0039798A34
MRRCPAVLVLLLLLAALTGCGGAAPDASAGSPTLDRIARSHELRVCSTGDYRPLTHLDRGTWRGIDVDMAADLAGKLDAKVTMVPTTWKTLTDDVVAGRCDIAVGGVSVTPDRAAKAAFTIPYLRDGKTPIVRCPDVARYSTVEQIDRPGVRAVVNPGGTNERFAREHLTKATIVPYPDNNTIFDAVADGRADLMVTDAIETRWQAAQHKGVLCSVHPDQPFTDSQKAYLTPPGDPAFTERVNGWLRTALDDGTWERFARPWLG